MRRALGLTLVVGCAAACGTQLPEARFRPSIVTVTQSAGAATAVAVPGQAGSTDAGPSAAGPTDAQVAGPRTTVETPGTVVAGPTGAVPTKGGGVAGPTKGTKATAVPTKKGGVVANYASDTGVTATTITVGNIISGGGIFGPEEFAKQQYGVRAFFADLNTRGGINGRKVIVDPYNDNGDGSQNVAIVKQAISTDKVFALVGNNIYSYDGAPTVQDAGLPDIASENIDGSYDEYSHLWAYGGDSYPRDNKQKGYPDGVNYGGSEIGAWLKQHEGVTKAGIVYYDQDDSRRGAQEFQREFSNAGIETNIYPVNLGLPNFSNTVAQMQSDGVQMVDDALDANGNAKLCGAIESNASFIDQMKLKLSTVSTFESNIAAEFKSAPKCRAKIWVEDSTWNYTDTTNPGVAAFQAAMAKYFPSRGKLNAEWSLHGWIAGMWFTDAAKACGAALTRACLEKGMRTMDPYTAGGLVTNSSFDYKPQSYFTTPGNTSSDCLDLAQWDDATGAWDTRAEIDKDCLSTPYVAYKPNG